MMMMLLDADFVATIVRLSLDSGSLVGDTVVQSSVPYAISKIV